MFSTTQKPSSFYYQIKLTLDLILEEISNRSIGVISSSTIRVFNKPPNINKHVNLKSTIKSALFVCVSLCYHQKNFPHYTSTNYRRSWATKINYLLTSNSCKVASAKYSVYSQSKNLILLAAGNIDSLLSDSCTIGPVNTGVLTYCTCSRLRYF